MTLHVTAGVDIGEYDSGERALWPLYRGDRIASGAVFGTAGAGKSVALNTIAKRVDTACVAVVRISLAVPDAVAAKELETLEEHARQRAAGDVFPDVLVLVDDAEYTVTPDTAERWADLLEADAGVGVVVAASWTARGSFGESQRLRALLTSMWVALSPSASDAAILGVPPGPRQNPGQGWMHAPGGARPIRVTP